MENTIEYKLGQLAQKADDTLDAIQDLKRENAELRREVATLKSFRTQVYAYTTAVSVLVGAALSYLPDHMKI